MVGLFSVCSSVMKKDISELYDRIWPMAVSCLCYSLNGMKNQTKRNKNILINFE